MLDGLFSCKNCKNLQSLLEAQMLQFSELLTVHQQMLGQPTNTEMRKLPPAKQRPESWTQKRKILERNARRKKPNDIA